MKNYKIKDATIAITYKCNAKCQMCNIWQRTDHENEISSKEILHLPKSLRDINLSGGEPFLKSDIINIVQTIKAHIPKAKIIISSNGFATDLILKNAAEILAVDSRIGVAISLDGMRDKHNEVRGVKGGFDDAIRTIKGLKKIGVKSIKIAFTMGEYNHKEFKKVYALSRDLGVEFTIAVVHSAENYFGKENKINNKEILIDELSWLLKQELSSFHPKRWLRAYFAYGLIKFLKTGKRDLPDYSGKTSVFIDPKGIVYPCDVSSEKMGNLTKKGFDVKEIDSIECGNSWMICTVRQAIKRHPIKVIIWILKNKFII